MYRRILLAYDGTREGRVALREGALLAHRCGAQVFLLAVVSGTAGAAIADGAHVGGMGKAQSEDFRAILDDGAMRLEKLGMKPVTRLVGGEPAVEIGKFAKEIGADLVVVGHRRQGIIARWWSGSSGAYIMDNIDCSLLVARNDISDEDFGNEFRRTADTRQT